MPKLPVQDSHPLYPTSATSLPSLPASPKDVPDFTEGCNEGRAMTIPTTALAARYAEMNARKRHLEQELQDIKHMMAKIEPQLLEKFAEDEVQSIRTQKGLVFIQKQLWAQCTDPTLFSTTDWSWMVKETVNQQTLSSAVRECEEDDNGNPILPDGLKDCIEVTNKYSVRVRRS